MGYIFGILLLVISIFLILLVLVQRGRGGGLTGALGGMGGSSAFGAKAGDVFTRITIVTAALWIVVCLAAGYWAGNLGSRLGDDSGVLGKDDPIIDLGLTPPIQGESSPPSEPSAESPSTDTPSAEAPADEGSPPADGATPPPAENGEANQ